MFYKWTRVISAQGHTIYAVRVLNIIGYQYMSPVITLQIGVNVYNIRQWNGVQIKDNNCHID